MVETPRQAICMPLLFHFPGGYAVLKPSLSSGTDASRFNFD
jgi:hypothetical protein